MLENNLYLIEFKEQINGQYNVYVIATSFDDAVSKMLVYYSMQYPTKRFYQLIESVKLIADTDNNSIKTIIF